MPIEAPSRKGSVRFAVDEAPRPDTTIEILAKLRPAFRDGGTITAGNAPSLNSGAAAMVVAERGFAEANGLAPMGRLVAPVSVEGDPNLGELGWLRG